MRSEPTSVCLVATDSVSLAAAWPRLTPAERSRFRGLRPGRRRQRWLAGRMLAKTLALGLADGAGADGAWDRAYGPAGPSATGPRLLDGAACCRRPAWRYRQLELLAPRGTRRERPRLRWLDDRRRPLAPSISHGGGWTAVAATASAPVSTADPGLDLEVVRDRRASFYRGNFTSAERAWARRSGLPDRRLPGWGSPADRFTLLWTIKEALLKSRARGLESVWDFPRVEVELPPLFEQPLFEPVAGPPRGAAGSARFGPFSALALRARVDHRPLALHLALAVGTAREHPPRAALLSLVTRNADCRAPAQPVRRTP